MNESVKFFTGTDFLIINALLWGNEMGVERGIEAVYRNNTGVIREAEEMTPEVRWGVSKEEGQKLFESYKRRTPNEINEATKLEFIKTAINDIRNICKAMQSATEEMVLYRNVAEEYAIKNLSIGEEIELKGITSTSTTGQKIDYGKNEFVETFQKYEIKIFVGIPILIVENDYRQENEVILPPMKYRVSDVQDGLVKLEAIAPLDIEFFL